MKKLRLLLAAAVLCGAFFTGCDKEKTEVKNDKYESVASTDETDAEATEALTEAKAEEVKPDAEKETVETPDDNSSAADSSGDDDDTNSSFDTYSNEEGDITETAVKLHEKCCETQWKYLVGCPYQLDYDDTIGEAVRVTDVNSLSEILADFRQVFADDGAAFNEKYFESDGKVYCYEGGRGANIYYKATELILISSDENSALFTAVSHYADPDTNEPMDSKSYDFKMIKDEGVWKASEFTLPY